MMDVKAPAIEGSLCYVVVHMDIMISVRKWRASRLWNKRIRKRRKK